MTFEMRTFTPEEREIVFRLASELTGTLQQGDHRREVLVANVWRRVQACGLDNLGQYLALTEVDAQEYDHLLSALTIHTTHWFREAPHFAAIESYLREHRKAGATIRLWSAACSTGEEAFSFGLLLESLRQEGVVSNYEVVGSDIDPVSIAHARRAVFANRGLEEFPARYHRFVSRGRGAAKGRFTLSKNIRTRTNFVVANLVDPTAMARAHFDVVVCRNVLIYFAPSEVETIIANLCSTLHPNGLLAIGHAERFETQRYPLQAKGGSIYLRIDDNQPLVHEAPTALPAQPSVLGIASHRVATAPSVQTQRDRHFRPDLILVGASTGGPEALVELLHDFPRQCPPLLVVQHMQISFLRAFAQRLAQRVGLPLSLDSSGAPLKDGTIYLALDDRHLAIRGTPGHWILDRPDTPPVNRHRPSVDVLFHSAARYNARSCALLLTGMGTDGADGLAALHRQGSLTAAQDEGSSTVFGMPRAAILRRAADRVGNLRELREWLDEIVARPVRDEGAA
jgi:chemotaxis response regulator CheB/chemotaxis methyl-accepting protein methylase